MSKLTVTWGDPPQTGTYKDYLRSSEWMHLREATLARFDHACAVCNATRFLQVHHRTYERLGHEEARDLVVLCEPCHAKVHDKLTSRQKAAAAKRADPDYEKKKAAFAELRALARGDRNEP